MYNLIKRQNLNSKGDTILEVLISVAILSLILTSSFALTNRSSIANRQAAERGEATKIAQAEVEELKYYLSIPNSTLPANGTYFCIDRSNPVVPAIVNLAGMTSGAVETNYNSVDNRCKSGTDLRYVSIIYRSPASANEEISNTYFAYVRWDSVSGRGADRVDLVHRIYPEAPPVFTFINSPLALIRLGVSS